MVLTAEQKQVLRELHKNATLDAPFTFPKISDNGLICAYHIARVAATKTYISTKKGKGKAANAAYEEAFLEFVLNHEILQSWDEILDYNHKLYQKYVSGLLSVEN